MGLTVILMLFALFVGRGASENDKRILVSDPSYGQTAMDHMQSEIQDLIVKMNAQQTIIQDLSMKLNAQQTTIQDLNAKVNTQQTTVSKLETSGKGVHFVRWGRTDCPGNYSLVYSGYAGGSLSTHKGAASEYVCMPPDPIWGPEKDIVLTYKGFIYGAEYEDASMFKMPNWMEDVPCAVCESSQYSTVMMIPGRTECYPGWTEGYHGDLASGHYDADASTQYVCVDQHPQALVGGGNTDENGKLFYGVEAKCNPLRCPPYEDGKLLSCAVCLK